MAASDGPGTGAEQRGSSRATVVVGLLPDQPLWVVQVAGEYAKQFDAELVCVSVDATRYAFQELPDGTLLTSPLDAATLTPETAFPPERVETIRALLEPTGVRWSLRELVGVAADALMAVADEVDALMIVVGTRHTGLRGALRTVFAGSVAMRLSHRQYRPVVVVPVAPQASDAAAVGDEPPGRGGAAAG